VETVQEDSGQWMRFGSLWDLSQYLTQNPATGVSGLDYTQWYCRTDGCPVEAYIMRKTGVEKWTYFPEVCFFRDKGEKGGHYCINGGRGTKSGTSTLGGFDTGGKNEMSSGGVGPGDYFARLDKNTNRWKNAISSFRLYGNGPYMLCLFDNDQKVDPLQFIWDDEGHNSCFIRARMRYSSEGVGLVGMNDKTNAIQLLQDVGFALIDDFSSSLEEAGTSSLPNSETMIARGRIDAIYRRKGRGSVNKLYHNDSASVIFVTGPITVKLYKDANQKGTHSTFYLDEGEWDVSYLNGINNAVSSYTFWDSKLSGKYRNK
jgi:hypothetical protein